MKFLHMADMHFDAAFTNLSDKPHLGDKKRLEQRQVFKEIIEYIKENNIELFFISGDLYEQKYIRKTTIEYINNLFKEIPNTKIFISPGNHDPYTKNSYYNTFIWNQNVTIFNRKINKIELQDIDIYGFGFTDFYCTDSKINDLVIENKEKINILITHGTLDGASLEEKEYNSISKKMLLEKDFNYVALGHIHKTNFEKTEKIIYPGSTISLGFDELGEHGIVVGKIEKNKLNINYISMEKLKFKEIELDCTNINSEEELIEKINELKLEQNNLYKIILTGNRNFEINIYNLYKYDLDEKIIKIKNKTKINYDLEKIKNNYTLRGIFAEEMLNKLKNASEEEKEIIEKTIEIGMEVLDK